MSFFKTCENCHINGIKIEINSYYWTCCPKCNTQFLKDNKLNMYNCQNPAKDIYGKLICDLEVNPDNHKIEGNFLICKKCGFNEEIN